MCVFALYSALVWLDGLVDSGDGSVRLQFVRMYGISTRGIIACDDWEIKEQVSVQEIEKTQTETSPQGWIPHKR
jgi:hypothetical protein